MLWNIMHLIGTSKVRLVKLVHILLLIPHHPKKKKCRKYLYRISVSNFLNGVIGVV
jgi:hypothetical protein